MDTQAETETLTETETAVPPARLGPLECLLAPDCGRVMVAAHRGQHLTHPENSLAGLRGAAEIGADFVEVDVRHTADEVLVLMHDDTVNRTTTGKGSVEELTWTGLQALELLKSDPKNPESMKIPRFSEALARELGVMLYIDQKTSRYDLVLAEIQTGEFYDVALVRDGLGTMELMAPLDDQLLVMPAVDFELMLDGALLAMPNLRIVELSYGEAMPEFNAYAHSLGIKVQQDVMGAGDIPAMLGVYTGWESFLVAGVDLVQTDMPHILIPLIQTWEETGVFPTEGPAFP
ncbi:MAG: glycerophosphodiester phosphodiesterase family protein [Pseudomonadota bacterium]